MKKLLSVVLVLAMLASMCIYLPMGVTAAEPAATPIYAEDFADMDGTYTLGELAELLGWTLLRGEETAEATIADGALTIDTTALATDVVFEMATNAALKANHTVQYDLTMASYAANMTWFAGIYTGTDNGETTTAFIPKVTYEGYHNMALAVGKDINEKTHSGGHWTNSGSGYEQVRPENVLFGGGYSKPATKTTWKNVIDVTDNQIDVYASGVRVNSTAAGNSYDNVDFSQYVGEGAYLRVQMGRVAIFDNISIVSGAEAITHNSNVVYEQNFDGITYDAANETLADLAEKTGFQDFPVKTGTAANTTYSIKNGVLDILNPLGAGAAEVKLYVPEMYGSDTIVVEFDQQYVYEGITGEKDAGDQPVEFQIYGRRSDHRIWLRYTQKGFATMRFYWHNGTSSTGQTIGQIRPQNVNYNGRVAGYSYTDGGDTHYNLYQSKDHNKIIFSKAGVEWYINDSLAMFLDPGSSAESTWQKYANQIMGHLLKWYVPQGCHVQLDNVKVTVDPTEAPELLITEIGVGGPNGNNNAEYIEVYNNSFENVNIYDYCVVNQTAANTYARKATAVSDVMFMYPGEHTFTSPLNAANTVTHTGPSYEDGWLAPGEVAYLWSATNTMYHQEEAKAGNGFTLDGFREAMGLAEDVKAFVLNNDYNRSMWNSSQMVYALAERDTYQPGYDPATNTGDQTVLDTVTTGFTPFVSYVYMLCNANFAPADNLTNFTASDTTFAANVCERTQLNDEATPQTLLTAQFQYLNKNTSREGFAINNANVTTRFDATIGSVVDAQKRAVTITVDGSAKTAYLAEDFSYAYTTEVEAPKFYKEIFAVVDGVIVMADDPAYGTLENITSSHTVQRYKVAMTTVPGVGIRFGGQNDANWEQSNDYSDAAAGLRWVTGIKASHIDQLMNSGLVAGVEIGTIITRNGAAFDETAKKVVAYNGYWFSETADANYADMTFFAGSVANMYVDNYEKNYKGVGYVTVTLTNGDTVTVTGDYVDANENNVLAVIEAAQMDPENGLTPEEMDLLNEYYAQFYGE